MKMTYHQGVCLLTEGNLLKLKIHLSQVCYITTCQFTSVTGMSDNQCHRNVTSHLSQGCQITSVSQVRSQVSRKCQITSVTGMSVHICHRQVRSQMSQECQITIVTGKSDHKCHRHFGSHMSQECQITPVTGMSEHKCYIKGSTLNLWDMHTILV